MKWRVPLQNIEPFRAQKGLAIFHFIAIFELIDGTKIIYQVAYYRNLLLLLLFLEQSVFFYLALSLSVAIENSFKIPAKEFEKNPIIDTEKFQIDLETGEICGQNFLINSWPGHPLRIFRLPGNILVLTKTMVHEPRAGLISQIKHI